MLDRYTVNHSVPLRRYAKQFVRRVVANGPNVLVKPIETTCRPCFVVGCGHSGTSLLVARLGAHPQAHLIPRETGIFLPNVGLLATRAVAQEWCYQTQDLGKTHFFEKTPKHVHVIKNIFRIFPEARVIIMIRNPIENVASLFERTGDLDQAITRWLVDNKPVLEHARNLQVRIIQYEDLVSDPGGVLGSLLTFVGLRKWEEVLAATAGGALFSASSEIQPNAARRREEVYQEIKNNRSKWNRRLGEREARVILERTRDQAVRLGYDISMLEQSLVTS